MIPCRKGCPGAGNVLSHSERKKEESKTVNKVSFAISEGNHGNEARRDDKAFRTMGAKEVSEQEGPGEYVWEKHKAVTASGRSEPKTNQM